MPRAAAEDPGAEGAARSGPAVVAATLRCGTVLTFEFSSSAPAGGDLVPCRRHGYCSVAVVQREKNRGPHGKPRRRRGIRRTLTELVAFLDGRPATTVYALRRLGFTLRLVAAAEREGLVAVNLVAGTVHRRTGP